MAVNIEELTEQIREVAAEYVGIDPSELDLNKKLRLEYGISSIEASELIMEMEDSYNIKIPVADAMEILTAQDAIDYLAKHLK